MMEIKEININALRDNANEVLLGTIGISYDEFEQLTLEEQERIIAEYHKKHPNKSKTVRVMIGDIFMNVPKGQKIFTAHNGYITAGQTLEESREALDKRFEKIDKKFKKLNRILKKNR